MLEPKNTVPLKKSNVVNILFFNKFLIRHFRHILLLVSFINVMQLKSQILWDSAFSNNVQSCLKDEISIVQFTVLSSSSTAIFKLTIPQGFVFKGIDFIKQNGAGIAYTVTPSGSNSYEIGLSSPTSGDVYYIKFRHFAVCNSSSATYSTADTFFYIPSGGLPTSKRIGDNFNVTSPSLNLSLPTNNPSPATLSTPISRKITISNSGFGATAHFVFQDIWPKGSFNINKSNVIINPTGINYTISSSKITLNSGTVFDTLIIAFDSAEIVKIGNFDSTFQNGENFVLNYTITPNNCGPSFSINNTFKIGWRCNSQQPCTFQVLTDGLAFSVPVAPEIVFIGLKRKSSRCWGETTIRDTIMFQNKPSAGIAKRLAINMGGADTITMDALDTSKIKYSIGKNGLLLKPKFKIINLINHNYFSTINCNSNLLGKISRVTFEVPTLNPGDTLYLYPVSDLPCANPQISNQNCNSFSGNDFFYNDIGVSIKYRNLCENVIYQTPYKQYAYEYNPRIYRGSWIDEGSTQMFDINQKGIIKVCMKSGEMAPTPVFNAASNMTRAKTEVKINLPSDLVLDSTILNFISIENINGAVLYPISHPSPYTWIFNGGIRSCVKINVKSKCDTTNCPGLRTVNITYRELYDSSYCNNYHTVLCSPVYISFRNSCNTNCCKEGAQTVNYSVERINFGQNDANNDGIPEPGPKNKALFNLNRAAYSDTIEIVQKTVIKTSSAHTQWEYFYAKIMLQNLNNSFTILSDSVFVDKSIGKDTAFSTNHFISNDTINIDVSWLPDLKNNDTIVFKIKLKVKFNNYSSGGSSYENNNHYSQANVYVSHSPNPSTANQFSCGLGLDFINIRSLNTGDAYFYLFSFPNTCNQFLGSFHFLNGPEHLYKIFDFEYRNWGYPNKLKVLIPNSISIDSIEFAANIWAKPPMATFDHSGKNLNFTRINDTLIIEIKNYFKPFGGDILLPDERLDLPIYVYMKGNCNLQNNWAYTNYSNFYHTFNNSIYTVPNQIIQNNYAEQPKFLISGSPSNTTALGKTINWSLLLANAGSTVIKNQWLYFKNKSSKITIDSIVIGTNSIKPHQSGFYRIGSISAGQNINILVSASQNTCNLDTLEVYSGYNCLNYPDSFYSNICSTSPTYLTLNHASTGMQTNITNLFSTPNNPEIPSAGNYSSNSINMCSSFPVEIQIQNTQTSQIYNPKLIFTLPINSNGIGLDFIADSAFIEYPIGTTPRKFSFYSKTSILTQITTGQFVLDLNQIDTVNFSTNKGLLGNTDPISKRSAILRFKFNTNCNLISGTHFSVAQQAFTSCGSKVDGFNNVVSGSVLNIVGVPPPTYLNDVKITSHLSGCDGGNSQVKITKIGNATPSATDSLRIFIGNQLTVDSIKCIGTTCPSAIPNFSQRVLASGTQYSLQMPSAISNGDSLKFVVKFKSSARSGYCNSIEYINAQVNSKISIYCSTLLGNCNNSYTSIGNAVSSVSLNKPELSIVSFASEYVEHSKYKYKYSLNLANSASGTAVNPINPNKITLFFDINNNTQFDFGIDSIVHTKTIYTYIPAGGFATIYDSFIYTKLSPDPNRRLYAMYNTTIETTNCACENSNLSNSVINLNIAEKILSAKYISNNNVLLKLISKNNYYFDRIYLFRKLKLSDSFELIRVLNNNKDFILADEHQFIDPALPENTSTAWYKMLIQYQNGTSSFTNTAFVLIDKKTQIFVYPNPSNSLLNVNLNDESIYNLFIFDAMGKIVLTNTVNKKHNQVDLSNLAPGPYLLKIQSTETSYKTKLNIIR